jgi:hypothetical protein
VPAIAASLRAGKKIDWVSEIVCRIAKTPAKTNAYEADTAPDQGIL